MARSFGVLKEGLTEAQNLNVCSVVTAYGEMDQRHQNHEVKMIRNNDRSISLTDEEICDWRIKESEHDSQSLEERLLDLLRADVETKDNFLRVLSLRERV